MSHFHQNKLKKQMSHLVLVANVAVVDPEVGGLDVEQDSDEQRPLLRNEDDDCTTSSGQREDAKVTTNYSLIPDASLPAQVRRQDAARRLCSQLREFIIESLTDISAVLVSKTCIFVLFCVFIAVM